jgi:hypothetical protein
MELTGDQVSLEAWIQPFGNSYLDGQGNQAFVATKEAYQGVTTYGLQVGGNWGTQVNFEVTTIENGDVIVGWNQALPTDQWTHVVGLYTGSEMRLYINGALVASEAQSGTFRNGPDPFWIGRFPRVNGYDTAYYGKVDEVALYDRALTPAEVAAHYQGVY